MAPVTTYFPAAHPAHPAIVDRVYSPRTPSGAVPPGTAHQTLRVFYPQPSAPKPARGWPCLFYTAAGSFSPVTISEIEATSPLLFRLLTIGWGCVVVVNTKSLLGPGGEAANVFRPFGSSEWDAPNIHWGEKDVTWARQYVGRYAQASDPHGPGGSPWPKLDIDEDLIVCMGQSAGSVYAAFVSLGADRAYGSAWEQTSQSTASAGFVGFECPGWLPALAGGFPGLHWTRPDGTAAPFIADADPEALAAASPSRWIREPGSLAPQVPAFLAYADGIASTDRRRETAGGACIAPGAPDYPRLGDPCLRDAIPPVRAPLAIHDFWFGTSLDDDLKAVGGVHPASTTLTGSQQVLQRYPDVFRTGEFVDNGNGIMSESCQAQAFHWLKELKSSLPAPDLRARRLVGRIDRET